MQLRGHRAAAKIAVVAHIFNADLWPEMVEAFRNIPEPFDLFVTLVTGASDNLATTILQRFPGAHVLFVDNHGRDIYPFLALIRTGALSGWSAKSIRSAACFTKTATSGGSNSSAACLALSSKCKSSWTRSVPIPTSELWSPASDSATWTLVGRRLTDCEVIEKRRTSAVSLVGNESVNICMRERSAAGHKIRVWWIWELGVA